LDTSRCLSEDKKMNLFTDFKASVKSKKLRKHGSKKQNSQTDRDEAEIDPTEKRPVCWKP